VTDLQLEGYKTSPPPLKPANGVPNEDPEHTPSTSRPSSSRWQNVLISTGGLTASISEQSLDSLVFCFRCLRIATGHLAGKITTLQSLLSIYNVTDAKSLSPHPLALASRIEKIKQEIIDTLRKVVDIVSTHAGGALPEPARSRVKEYILSLPARWAAASNSSPPGGSPSPENGHANGVSPEAQTGWRVLTLAKESLEVLKSVMNVVADTLQSAENWAGTWNKRRRTNGNGAPVADEESSIQTGKDES
jgi:transcriptional repressor OPI1